MNKKLMSAIISSGLAVSLLGGLSASAESGEGYVEMCGSKTKTSYSCTFWGQSNFWDVWWGADGTSKTFWYGSNPFYLTSITHQDIISCTGLGSLSIGITPSGPNASSSISGHSVTYSYTDYNTYQINVELHYKHTGMQAAWNYDMYTHATLQDGSNFYNVYSD